MARAQFSELDEAKRKIISKKCYLATLECKFRGSVIKDKYNFASPQFILDKAKYYVDNFASASEKLEYIKEKNEYENLTKSNGIYYKENTKYQGYIEDISKIEDMDELDRYIKGNNPSGKEIPIHSLNLAIQDRTRALGDKNGLYSSVKEKLLAYGKYKYEKKEKNNKEKSRLTLEENKLLSKLTLQDFLDSEHITKQDYCKDTGLSINVFDKRLSNVKEYDDEFYTFYLAKLEEKKQAYYEKLKPVVEDILTSIATDEDYSIIDYYLKYKDEYKFEDLCQSCNKYHLDIRTLKSFLSKADVRSSLNHDAFINQYYKAYDHEFSDEEKEQIFAYLKDSCIPTNWHNVSLVVGGYYKAQSKTKTK